MSILPAWTLIYLLCLVVPAYAVDDAQAIFGTSTSSITTNSTHTRAGTQPNLLPFKNDLFAHTTLLSSDDHGNYLEYDFDEMRDVNGRDEIPVKKALNKFVELTTKTQPQTNTLHYPTGTTKTTGTITTAQVGQTHKAKFAVIFIHGAGGSKELGINDWTFGGNFNRLKNLTLLNKGVYFSPSVTFDINGVEGTAEIIRQIKHQSPNAKIIIACGSAGSFICYNLLTATQQANKISALVILGGAYAPDEETLKQVTKNQIALLIAHGTNDRVLHWTEMEKAYNSAKQQTPSNFILYRTGGHGTPIRMIDWYKTLNWIQNVKAKK